jgi:hypothetical protein
MLTGEGDNWPDSSTNQVQVMVLGTYRMDNPSLDEANVETEPTSTTTKSRRLE